MSFLFTLNKVDKLFLNDLDNSNLVVQAQFKLSQCVVFCCYYYTVVVAAAECFSIHVSNTLQHFFMFYLFKAGESMTGNTDLLRG